MPLNNPDPSAAKAASGTYSGDNTVNRAIPHGLPGKPKLILSRDLGGSLFYNMGDAWLKGTSETGYAVTTPDSTNFYVGNATNYGASANASGVSYKWVALL